MPSIAEWLLIIGFIIGALGLASSTFVLSTRESSAILFAVGVLTLLAKILTTDEEPTEPEESMTDRIIEQEWDDE